MAWGFQNNHGTTDFGILLFNFDDPLNIGDSYHNLILSLLFL